MSVCLSALLLFTVVLAPVAAQKRPDFSGAWVEDESQRKSPYATAPAGPGALAAPKSSTDGLSITQTADRITIARTFMSITTRMTYTFDGRENVNHTGAQTHTTRTRWDGGRLVTEGSVYQVTSQGESSWKIREVRWMTAKGEMAVEHTVIDEDGERTVFRVFRRKSG
ncbi:MAG TPA: hypothetical protein VM364_09370 [Vicinamibacterales bacterium]|nr:hypothetical protein [Vicinamibacterales bacterium]